MQSMQEDEPWPFRGFVPDGRPFAGRSSAPVAAWSLVMICWKCARSTRFSWMENDPAVGGPAVDGEELADVRLSKSVLGTFARVSALHERYPTRSPYAAR